jgi:hypothetical protein
MTMKNMTKYLAIRRSDSEILTVSELEKVREAQDEKNLSKEEFLKLAKKLV